MYTAEILNKKMVRGLLSVEVKFSNGEGAEVIDTYETNQSQSSTWLDEQIKRRITDLNALTNSISDIKLGVFNETKINVIKSDKETYRDNLFLYRRYLNAVNLGVIESNIEAITTLKSWLINNFQEEYINLF